MTATRGRRVIQEDEYYSFGLRKPTGGYDYSNNNRYLYNGKEVQTDLANQYDYGARFYDPVIARWTTIYPMAEKLRRYTLYNYGDDNPIRKIDPDGMFSEDFLYRHASTFVTPEGKIIKHLDDGDNRVYVVDDIKKWDGTKKNLKVAGFEDPSKNCIPGHQYEQFDPIGLLTGNNMLFSKGGKQNLWDNYLPPLTDQELQKVKEYAKRNKDTQLLKKIDKEEKRPGQRNKQKRGNNGNDNGNEPVAPVSNFSSPAIIKFRQLLEWA